MLGALLLAIGRCLAEQDSDNNINDIVVGVVQIDIDVSVDSVAVAAPVTTTIATAWRVVVIPSADALALILEAEFLPATVFTLFFGCWRGGMIAMGVHCAKAGRTNHCGHSRSDQANC
jgi:hypothetical protein